MERAISSSKQAEEPRAPSLLVNTSLPSTKGSECLPKYTALKSPVSKNVPRGYSSDEHRRRENTPEPFPLLV